MATKAATKPAAAKPVAKKPVAAKAPAPTAEKKERAVDAQGRRVKTPGEPALARYAEIEPTTLQHSFADWLTENTGYKVDAQSVALATALRGEFQKSPENQADLKERREAAAAAKAAKEQRAADRKAKAAEEAAKPKVTKAAKAAEAEEEDEAPAKKPVARRAPTAAAKAKEAAAASAAKPKRRRAPAKAAALEDEI